MIVYGRSDAALKPGGVRIGTAEIYRQVERSTKSRRVVGIGQEWEGDTRVVLFVDCAVAAARRGAWSEIKQPIRANAKPRHVRAKIVAGRRRTAHQVGKIVEFAVREVVHGRPVKNLEALANPER